LIPADRAVGDIQAGLLDIDAAAVARTGLPIIAEGAACDCALTGTCG
jgi:hypothetical protein